MTDLARLMAPTSWASPPDRFSPTTLQAIEACPRRWQFMASTWGVHARFPQRPHPAAVEGRIVHQALERLARALGLAGRPEIGSAAFRAALEQSQFFESIANEVAAWNQQHLGGSGGYPGARIRSSPQELANRAVSAFRSTYAPGTAAPRISEVGARSSGAAAIETGDTLMERLDRHGVLAEVELRHPSLPYGGVADQVVASEDGIAIVDFKMGAERHNEHVDQLLSYASIWKRITGVPPTRLIVQYVGSRLERQIDASELDAFEAELEVRIERARHGLTECPAPALPSAECQYCAVRARCNEGWASVVAHYRSTGGIDVEVEVLQDPTDNGFHASLAGESVHVVYEAVVGSRLPAVARGERMRLVDALMRDDGSLQVRSWTEVFVVPA